VWQLEAGKLLAATEEGRSVAEIREFLAARSGAPLPDTVARLFGDIADRCARVHDRGLARLIECAEMLNTPAGGPSACVAPMWLSTRWFLDQ